MAQNHPKQKQKQTHKQNKHKQKAVKRHEWEFDPSSHHMNYYTSARLSVEQEETSQTITDATTPTSDATPTS